MRADRKRRTLRNLVARALLEGYDENVEQYRFALDSADIAIDAIIRAVVPTGVWPDRLIEVPA